MYPEYDQDLSQNLVTSSFGQGLLIQKKLQKDLFHYFWSYFENRQIDR